MLESAVGEFFSLALADSSRDRDELDAFRAADDIDFAYLTTRYLDNAGEGKPRRSHEAQD